MMLPDQFIALAEETGQIVPLGSWVLRQAAADIARWRRDRAPTQASGAGPGSTAGSPAGRTSA